MKKVTVETYRNDRLYPKVVRATARLLKTSDEIAPVAILIQLGNLEQKAYEAWCRCQVPYLERVFQGSLSKANRILRILGFHAHDLNMVPSPHTYRSREKNTALRFSKSGDSNLEKSYARHFRWNQSPEKKQLMIETTLSEQEEPTDSASAGRLRVD